MSQPLEPSFSRRSRIGRRAIVTLACVALAGVTLGGFAVRQYDDMPRPSARALFLGLGLSKQQTHQVDSVMNRYACALDSLDRTTAPAADAFRGASRREIEAMLTPAQIIKFRERLAAIADRRRHKRGGRGRVCVRHG